MDKLALTAAFPTLTAGALAYKAVHDAFSAALGDSDQANATAREKTRIKDTARAAVEAALTQNGHVVEGTPGVTADMAMSVGFGVKDSATPVGKLPQVQNYSLTTGDQPGEVDSHWDATYGQSVYEHARCTSDPAVEANWSLIGTSSASKTTHKGLPSGTRVWQRVRAKAKVSSEVNDGAWSQPATVIVP